MEDEETMERMESGLDASLEESLAEPAAPEATGPRPVIVAEHFSRWYGDVIAVNDVSLRIAPGITGLLGPNGAGKSTLLAAIMGLLKPSVGTVRVLDESPWDNPGLLKRIGYVPEAPAPWRDQTGQRCAERAGLLSGMDAPAASRAASAALERVGLGAASNRVVAGYSHGMQQRLKLALALLHDPELLVLDEPLLGTDPIARRDLLGLLRNLAAEGKSIILSTHVLPDVEALTETIVLLDHGRLMAHGTVPEIRDLLDRYPRTVRIATPDPRALGATLWSWPTVLSVQADDAAVTVRTDRPSEFFGVLQRFLAEGGAPFSSVTSPDDNVEAVFRYLVG